MVIIKQTLRNIKISVVCKAIHFHYFYKQNILLLTTTQVKFNVIKFRRVFTFDS
jgi:hypothetical protein